MRNPGTGVGVGRGVGVEVGVRVAVGVSVAVGVLVGPMKGKMDLLPLRVHAVRSKASSMAGRMGSLMAFIGLTILE